MGDTLDVTFDTITIHDEDGKHTFSIADFAAAVATLAGEVDAHVDPECDDARDATRRELMARVEHIERLKAERDDVNTAIRDAFSEAAARGYDRVVLKDVIKRRAEERVDVEARDTMIAHYEAVLAGAVDGATAARAAARDTASAISDSDADTLADIAAGEAVWRAAGKTWVLPSGAKVAHATMLTLDKRKLTEAPHPQVRTLSDRGRAALEDGR